jgi:predicted patatin/cPLA2 family phospholipase
VKPKIGLALSGGGSKGAFTVGVLKVVDQMLDPSPYAVISGTSTGALIATPLIHTMHLSRASSVVKASCSRPPYSVVGRYTRRPPCARLSRKTRTSTGSRRVRARP